MIEYNVTYREKNGGIQVIVSYKDELGAWKQKTRQGFPNTRPGNKAAKAAADEILQELKNRAELNIMEGFEDLTIGELKADYLDHIEIHREYNTYQNYKQSLEHFKLDNTKVEKLKLGDVQKCINTLVDKVSVTTIERRVTVFKCMLNYAHRQFNIPIPSLASLVIPSKDKKKVVRKALEQDILDSIINYYKTKESDYYIIVFIASKAGLRVGEIMGLTWNDVNLDNSQIIVNKQWKIDKKTKKYTYGDLKSPNSYRTVPISSDTLNVLKSYKNLVKGKSKQRLIKAVSTNSMTVNLDKQLKKKFNTCIHELRHTYATTLISNGMDFKTAASILGHDVEQTMKVYSHVTNDMFKRASELIDKIFTE